jgi:hypothetical protein
VLIGVVAKTFHLNHVPTPINDLLACFFAGYKSLLYIARQFYDLGYFLNLSFFYF